MSHKRLWVAAAIIAVVIFVGFILSVPHTRDIGNSSSSQNVATSAPSVSLHDSFKKGTHTITGLIEARNACASVSAQASLVGDATNASGILVMISLEKDSGVCLQVPTPIHFTTTVSAPAHLPITATVNGEVATTTAS